MFFLQFGTCISLCAVSVLQSIITSVQSIITLCPVCIFLPTHIIIQGSQCLRCSGLYSLVGNMISSGVSTMISCKSYLKNESNAHKSVSLFASSQGKDLKILTWYGISTCSSFLNLFLHYQSFLCWL